MEQRLGLVLHGMLDAMCKEQKTKNTTWALSQMIL